MKTSKTFPIVALTVFPGDGKLVAGKIRKAILETTGTEDINPTNNFWLSKGQFDRLMTSTDFTTHEELTSSIRGKKGFSVLMELEERKAGDVYTNRDGMEKTVREDHTSSNLLSILVPASIVASQAKAVQQDASKVRTIGSLVQAGYISSAALTNAVAQMLAGSIVADASPAPVVVAPAPADVVPAATVAAAPVGADSDPAV